jgi:SAM-dependent methyltransferase
LIGEGKFAARNRSCAELIALLTSSMIEKTDKDYVLGTNEEEIDRLGLQHRVWRPTTLACWRRAGITVGSRVIDLGCGPGYATMDLAEIVGRPGEVVALERSNRFLEIAQKRCAARGLTNVRFRQADLAQDSLGESGFDFSWCRWVLCFVSDPEGLVKRVAAALRRGGHAIFHEYLHYKTWRFAPRKPAHESFVEQVIAAWRADGGEPDIAPPLLSWLPAAGLRVIEIRPRILTISPRDYAWHWPASFIENGLTRLQELGRVTADWAQSVRTEFAEAEADPATICITPLFAEIIARRE